MLSLFFGFNHLIFSTQDTLNNHEVTTHAMKLTGLTYIRRNNNHFPELVDLLQGLYKNILEIENTKKMVDEAQSKIDAYDYIKSILKSNIDLKTEQQQLFVSWKESQFKDKTIHAKMETINKAITLSTKSSTTENLLGEIPKLRYQKRKEIQKLLGKLCELEKTNESLQETIIEKVPEINKNLDSSIAKCRLDKTCEYMRTNTLPSI